MIGLFTSRLAGPIAASAAVLLAIALTVTTVQRNNARSDLAKAADQIHNPHTGYVVRLDRCQRNTAGLETSIKVQNASIEVMAQISETRMKAADEAVERARASTEKAQGRIAVLMSRPPVGADTCARVLDVDSRVLEALK